MKISIITVAYNSEQTISDTIESVLSQTYPDIEYVLVDGGSKDSTLDIIKRYEPLFGGRMHWISEKDQGIYDAMNKGIRLSTGEVIGILNSDDFFTSREVLSRTAKEFTGGEVEAVYGDVHFVKPGNLQKCVRYYSSGIFRPCLLRFGFMPAHPSFYVKRNCYEKIGLYALDYKIAGDYDLMIRFFYTHRINYKYLKMDFVTMRTGGVSTAGIKSKLLLNREIVKACRKYGIYTNLFFVSLKYFYKIFELIKR